MMDLDLPRELLSTPLSLVSLVGLEEMEDKKTAEEIWKRFAENRGLDRVPMLFQKGDQQGTNWPEMKPKRNTYEWFIPKGIVKRNWMEKHLWRIPAVVVIFMELDWRETRWNEKKEQCAERVQKARSLLSGRSSKLSVVLVQRETSLPDSDHSSSSSEQLASSLCSACELSTRSLFVLPVLAENLQGYVIRLETAFHELAQNYYHQEIRTVKAHRDHLNKTTHLYLFVRHQFKAGFLNELKRDFHAAYKHYGQAYSLLMEVRATDTNIMEVKTVAGFISYKICKLAFRLNLPRDAISQFRKHMDIFQQKVGMDVLEFEHKAWLSKQCEFFADVFAEAIKNGLPAIQTQHPGLYYQQSAQYAISRRELAEELCSEVKAYPEPDPMANASKMEFFGQRPWRPGKVSLEPPDMELENVGIQALLHHERNNVSHNDNIIELLKSAIVQFKAFRSPRSESHLTVIMAEELKNAQRYRQALDLLLPVMDHYRREKWRPLLDAVLSLGMKCAFLLVDVELYAKLSLDLCSENSSLGEEEKTRVMQNLMRLFEDPPKVPGAEPGLTSKKERAAVGEAAKLWSETIKKTDLNTKVDMTGLCSCIEFKVSYLTKDVRADESIKLGVFLKNRTSLSLPLTSLGAITSGEEYDLNWKGQEEVAANSSFQKIFEFRPLSKDVGKVIKVEKVIARVGKSFSIDVSTGISSDSGDKSRDFIIPKFRPPGDETDSDGLEFDFVDIQPEVDVKQRTPLMTISVITDDPVMVGEWFAIRVRLDNKESDSAREIEFSAILTEAQDPIIADTTKITFDPLVTDMEALATPTPSTEEKTLFGSEAQPLTKKLGAVKAGSNLNLDFYLKASTTGLRGVKVQVSYRIKTTEGIECQCSISEVINLETMEPFALDTEFLSLRQRKIDQAYTDELFLLTPKLRSLTTHAVKVADSWVEVRPPIQLQSATPSQLQGCVLYPKSHGIECYPLIVRKADLTSSLDVQEFTVGKYVIKWSREDSSFSTTSTFELSNVKVCLSSLFAMATMPAFGTVRTPLTLSYSVYNRTDKVQEYSLSIEPSEAFMMSGNKQLHFKILPERSYSLSYVLYPLLAGENVALPTIKLVSTRVTQTQDANEIMERLIPKTITVLPRTKSDGVKAATSEEPFYTLTEPVCLENEPPPEGGKSKVVKAQS